jgi:hypothetical protein
MDSVTANPHERRLAQRRRLLPAKGAVLLAMLAVPIVGGCGPGPTPPTEATITATVDATGGLLVVGDLLDIKGTGLALVTRVLVDEKRARIISRTATNLRIQIPQGVPTGQDTLTLDYTKTDGSTDQVSDTIDVHRLVVFIGTQNDKIVVADTTNQSVLITFDVMTNGQDYPLVPTTANNGSLALIATGTGLLYWIDLTATPPWIGSLDLGAAQLLGVAVAPAQDLAAVYDLGGGAPEAGAIYTVTVDEDLPPYAVPIALGGAPLSLPRPHGLAFINLGFLGVALEDLNELAIVQRIGNTLTDTLTRVDQGSIVSPTMVRLVPDGTKLLVPSWTDGQVRLYDVLPGTVSFDDSIQLASMKQALAVDVHPTGAFAYVIDYSNSLIVPIGISGRTLIELLPGPAPSSPILRSLAVDPVEGKYLYVGKDTNSFLDIYTITNGSTLALRPPTSLIEGDADLAVTKGIVIQP